MGGANILAALALAGLSKAKIKQTPILFSSLHFSPYSLKLNV
jgi:hypothetical protein